MVNNTRKRTFTLAFKQEVLRYTETHACSVYATRKYFSTRDNYPYDQSMFYQWHANKEKILDSGSSRRRVAGGGRKPLLQDLENLIADEVVELRIQKIKVTRAFIADRARLLAEEHGIEFRASNSWLDNFMLRHDFALRRTTGYYCITTPNNITPQIVSLCRGDTIFIISVILFGDIR